MSNPSQNGQSHPEDKELLKELHALYAEIMRGEVSHASIDVPNGSGRYFIRKTPAGSAETSSGRINNVESGIS